MKRFKLEAIVDEKYLWELMAYLEQHRAEGILARPYLSNGAAPRVGKGGRSEPRRRGTGARGVVRAAILDILNKGEQFTLKTIEEKTGLTKANVYGTTHVLLKEGVIKRVGKGEYAAGRKARRELAAAEAKGETA